MWLTSRAERPAASNNVAHLESREAGGPGVMALRRLRQLHLVAQQHHAAAPRRPSSLAAAALAVGTQGAAEGEQARARDLPSRRGAENHGAVGTI